MTKCHIMSYSQISMTFSKIRDIKNGLRYSSKSYSHFVIKKTHLSPLLSPLLNPLLTTSRFTPRDVRSWMFGPQRRERRQKPMYANVMVNPWLKHWFIGDVDVDVPNIQHILKSTVHTCQFQQNPVCVRISLLSTRLSWLELELSVVEVWLAAVDAMF